jgi:predicted Fe-Mo cluster-binding NifX family protein
VVVELTDTHLIKEFPMKLAVTSTAPDINAPIDPRFGRASYVLIIDSETLDYQVLDNANNQNKLKGAGIQAGTMINQAGAEVLITGFCGPNAITTLNAANIKVILGASGNVKEAVMAFNEGTMSYSTEPNTEGHSM